MNRFRNLILILALVISGSLFAQSQRELGQLMRERNEYYFTLSVDNPSEIQGINRLCSVDGTDGKNVVCYANQQQYDKLLLAGYQPTLLTPPSMLYEAVMWDGSNRAAYEWDSYPTYDAYQSMMEAFPSQALSDRTCTLLDLGTLNSGRKILGVRLYKGQPDGKPKFLYSSTMHGDEVTGMMLMLRLIDEFCTSNDTRIVNLLNNLDIFIFPLTNPDGTYYGGNSTMNSARRYNMNGTDLNRNYKDYYIGEHPDGESYALETQWTMQLAQDYLFTMSANYHGGAEVANYPWDAITGRHPDDAWYQYVCLDYVSRARAVSSSYMTDTYSSGITNGYDWYQITGSRQDYENAYGQCREITMECSSTKKPSASTMPTYWNYNHDAMLGLLEQCLNGVHGFVYDAVTNEPLQGVTVTVENHDNDISYVTSHNIGDFHRPIKGGTYTFTFAKQGYYSQSVQVTVADGQRVDLNIQLEPNLNLTAGFTASTTNVSLGQSISFTDTSEGMVSSWSWTFEGASPSTSTEQNPTGITYNTPGDYDVTLTITGPTGNTATKTMENYIHVSESTLIGDGGTSTSDYLPSYNYYNYSLTEQIYTPADLGEGGIITSIAFYNGGSTKTRTYDFYMKSTTKNTFTGAADWIAVSASDKVFSGSVTMTANEWTIINFTTPFMYDGVSNVVLVADDNTGSYTNQPHMSCRVFSAESQALYVYNDNTDFNPMSPPTSSSSYNAVLTTKNQLQITKEPFPTTPFNVTVSANPARAGSASGSGEYTFGETCTVTATPNSGYTFTGWTEDGTVVSEDMEYSFMVSADRDLVANFTFVTATSGNCYYSMDNMSAGSYVMGYLNGNTLTMLSQSNTSVTAASATVTPTDYGFSVDEETTLSQITLTAYGSSGQQFTIMYNNRYLARSNNSLAWTTSANNSSSRWYINANGIYLTVSNGYYGSTTYYLYYNNGSFQLSTNQQNNITFYAEGNCPAAEFTITATAEPAEGGAVEGSDIYFEGETCTLTATANSGYTFINWTEGGVEVSTDATYSFEVTGDRTLVANFEESITTEVQSITLSGEWGWWSTYLDITLEQLEEALGTAGVSITSLEEGFVGNYSGYWAGALQSITPGKMYRIRLAEEVTITLSGTLINPANCPITLKNGINWIGYPLKQSMSLVEAFDDANPVNGDMVSSLGATAMYFNGSWYGELQMLEPGKGYVYKSNATDIKTFTYPTTTK